MAASEEDHNTVFNDDEIDEDDDTDPLIPNVAADDEDDDQDPDSDTDSDDADTNSTSSIIPTAAIPAPLPRPPLTPSSSASVTVAIPAAAVPNGGASAPLPFTPTTATLTTTATPTHETPDPRRHRIDDQLVVTERRPVVEDSRRLFQRLWTDEDEIELLKGFLEYTAQRSTVSSGHHHHDTAAFYDQIKSKLQLDCNKNQLVEKLRRLKKKYRNVVNRVSSGKEFVFKSPHDQATFEISRKIWSNSTVHRQELEDDDQQNPSPISVAPNLPNLNHADQSLTNSCDNRMIMTATTTTANPNTTTTPNRPRKRSRVKMEENTNLNLNLDQNQRTATVRNANFGGYEAVVNVNSMQGLIEETVRNCLSPLLKEVVDSAVSGLAGVGGAGAAVGGGAGGVKGIGSLSKNAMPSNLSGLISGIGGELAGERWRKQHILELEVYSKRLELVQDQIKTTLEELRSTGGS